jgi:hypothetical protein
MTSEAGVDKSSGMRTKEVHFISSLFYANNRPAICIVCCNTPQPIDNPLPAYSLLCKAEARTFACGRVLLVAPSVVVVVADSECCCVKEFID